MALTDILAGIDQEIARLTEARRLLTENNPETPAPAKRGPKPKGDRPVAKAKDKRVMSDEARQRIGDAQRKRHAAKKGLPTPAA